VQVDPRFNQPCKPGPDTSKLVTGVNCRNLILDGYPREFLVYVPNGLPSGKTVPLVFMLHGSSGDGEKFLDTSGWRQLADAEKFVAVFPTSLEYWVTDRREGDPRWSTKWNDYTLPDNIDVSKRLPGVPASAPWPADDITFIRAMIADVNASIKLDPKRIYVAGFSNGGQLASRVAVEASDLVAAVGASEGFMFEKHDAPRSTPIYYTIGTIDDRFVDAFSVPEIPLDPTALQQIPGIRAIVGSQTATFGYDTTPCKVDTQAKATYLTFCDKDPSNGTGEFILAIIGGLTHNYPNGQNNDAGFVGAKAMWDFFVAHPMP
jgi:polyhydroxybutyrate depolymerase